MTGSIAAPAHLALIEDVVASGRHFRRCILENRFSIRCTQAVVLLQHEGDSAGDDRREQDPG